MVEISFDPACDGDMQLVGQRDQVDASCHQVLEAVLEVANRERHLRAKVQDPVIKELWIPVFPTIGRDPNLGIVELIHLRLQDLGPIKGHMDRTVFRILEDHQPVALQEGPPSGKAHEKALTALFQGLQVHLICLHQPCHMIPHQGGLGSIKRHKMGVPKDRTNARVLPVEGVRHFVARAAGLHLSPHGTGRYCAAVDSTGIGLRAS